MTAKGRVHTIPDKSTASAPSGRMRGVGLRSLLVAICILAVFKFWVRLMPITHLTSGRALKVNYLAARAWTRGLDPYDHAVLTRIWIDAGGTPATAPARARTPSVYPPTALALFSPLASLPWSLASVIWCGLNMAALATLLGCLHSLAGIRWLEAESLCLVAGALALEPVSNTVQVGQTSILVSALAAASIVYGLNDRRLASGVLEGLGIALKPQLALAFAAPFVIARRWKICVAITIMIVALAWIALSRFASPAQCITSWLASLHFAFDPGRENDPRLLVETARQMGKDWARSPMDLMEFVNLQYPLSTFINNRLLVEALTWSTTLALIVPVLRSLVRCPTDITLLHCVSLLALLNLLFFYHRSYDAVVLVFPMAWALSPIVPRSQSWPVLLTLVLFSVPLDGVLLALDKLGFIPAWLSSGAVWRSFVLPCQAWALLIVSSWLAYCLARSEAVAAI
jgi:hypothetical protein